VKLLWTVLLMIVGVVFIAYWFQKRLLRPVESLGDGVARMSAGQLDVALPLVTHDELGTLTTAFNQMVRRVKDMLQARDQLLLDVSHELRSPLTRMKVALALLPEDDNKASLDADVKEMEAMISELLELERLRTPHGLRKQKQDMVPILREAVQLFEKRAPGVQLTARPQTIFANVDCEKLRTVLRNLLDNAFKYSLPDSQPIILSVSEIQDSVVIRVQDDGQGIPDAERASVFEPFFRIDPSRSKKTGGYGLGLSMCKRIVEAHGGTINIESNPGRGVSFVVKIPIA
jgi:signal transduction histidine kinase